MGKTNTRCVQDTHSVTFQLRKFDIISTFSFPLRMEPYSTFPKTQRSSQNFQIQRNSKLLHSRSQPQTQTSQLRNHKTLYKNATFQSPKLLQTIVPENLYPSNQPPSSDFFATQ